MFSERLLRRLGSKVWPLPTVDEHVRLDTYPPPLPAGWYPLCGSDEVGRGQTLFIQALGEQFVVYWSTSGRLAVLDAYCPYLDRPMARRHRDLGEYDLQPQVDAVARHLAPRLPHRSTK